MPLSFKIFKIYILLCAIKHKNFSSVDSQKHVVMTKVKTFEGSVLSSSDLNVCKDFRAPVHLVQQ